MKAPLFPDGSSPEGMLEQSAQNEGAVAEDISTSETFFRHKPDQERPGQEPLGPDETLFQRIAANVPGMVYQFLLHPDGSIEWPFISEGCRAIYEKEPDELRRNPIWPVDIIHPDDRDEFHRSVAALFILKISKRRSPKQRSWNRASERCISRTAIAAATALTAGSPGIVRLSWKRVCSMP
jgi:hypothetical protein